MKRALILVLTVALLTGCSTGKNASKDDNTEQIQELQEQLAELQSQIEEAEANVNELATSEASIADTEEKSIIEETFECSDVMKSASFEDGKIQIDDIIVSCDKSMTMDEVYSLFKEKGRYTMRCYISDSYSDITKKNKNQFSEYNPDGLVPTGGSGFLVVEKDGQDYCFVVSSQPDIPDPDNDGKPKKFVNFSDSVVRLVYPFQNAKSNAWFAHGIPANGENYSALDADKLYESYREKYKANLSTAYFKVGDETYCMAVYGTHELTVYDTRAKEWKQEHYLIHYKFSLDFTKGTLKTISFDTGIPGLD